MPKRTDIEKILIIGSGPIVIGQAAESDLSGSQAAMAPKRRSLRSAPRSPQELPLLAATGD